MRTIFILTLFLITGTCLAQETVKRESKLTPQVKEEYQVLNTDYNQRQGTYAAYYKKKLLAAGRYNQNKKVGNWTFFDLKGTVIQRFNYDTSTLMYEAVEDTSSAFRYIIDKPLSDTDRVTKPIKPGGRYYGYLRCLNLFKVPQQLIGVSNREYSFYVEMLISPYGRLAEYKVHVNSLIDAEDQNEVKLNINLLNEDDKIFIPATYNKESISSRIFIRCSLINNGRLAIYGM